MSDPKHGLTWQRGRLVCWCIVSVLCMVGSYVTVVRSYQAVRRYRNWRMQRKLMAISKEYNETTLTLEAAPGIMGTLARKADLSKRKQLDVVTRVMAYYGIPPIREHLPSDTMRALDRLTQRAIPYLLDDLQRGTPIIRRNAAFALQSIDNDSRIVSATVHALQDSVSEVRMVCAASIGRRTANGTLTDAQKRRCAAALLPLLRDPDQNTRVMAAESLCGLGHMEGAIEVLEQEAKSYPMAARCLERLR